MSNTRNESIIKDFGVRLSVVRKQKGITQLELGEKVGVSQIQIARIEKGHVNTTISTVYGLANALGVRASEII